MSKINMNEKGISYQKEITMSNNEIISLSFLYEVGTDISLSDLEYTLEKNLNSNLFPINLEHLVIMIRTMLRKCNEKELHIKIQWTKEQQSSIFYKNGELLKYSSNFNQNNIQGNLNYKIGDGLSISIQDYDCLFVNNNELVSQELSKLNKLKKINILKDITHNEEILCKLYQLFYEEQVDFRNVDKQSKAQIMISILTFLVPMGDLYNVFMNYNNKPTSFEVIAILKRLKLFGSIENCDYCNNVVFDNYEQKRIITYGRTIRDYIAEKGLDEIEFLKFFGTSFYISQTPCSTDEKLKKHIGEKTKAKSKKIEDAIQLIRKIERF